MDGPDGAVKPWLLTSRDPTLLIPTLNFFPLPGILGFFTLLYRRWSSFFSCSPSFPSTSSISLICDICYLKLYSISTLTAHWRGAKDLRLHLRLIAATLDENKHSSQSDPHFPITLSYRIRSSHRPYACYLSCQIALACTKVAAAMGLS